MKHFEMKGKGKIICSLLAAPFIIAVLLLIVYAIKDVFPFGNNNISYYDMSQSLIPIYYHTYDVLHGTAGIFFDWYTGSGSTMVDTAGNFIFSPFNIFFLFVKRESLLENMSFFLLIKMMTAAFCMSFFVWKKWKNIDYMWIAASGISYASCGFILQYYSNIHFLDIVAMFPLLVLAFEQMLFKGKKPFYIVMLGLCFITNIYLSVMICIYLIMSGVLSMKCRMKDDERKKAALRMGACTIDALLISAVLTLPNIIILLNSSRAQTASDNGIISQLATIFCDMEGQKYFMLYGSEIGLAFMICLLFKRGKRKEKRYFKRNCWILIFLILPVFIEPINQLWHIGGYVHFPLRFGYMICLETWVFVCDFLTKDNLNEESKITTISTLLAPAMIPMIGIVLFGFVALFLQYGIRNRASYEAYWLIAFLLVLYYALSYNVRKTGKMKNAYGKTLCFIMITMQAGLGIYGFTAPAQEYSLECEDDIIIKTLEAKAEYVLDDNPLSKVKDADAALNANYGFILQKGCLANWTLGVEANAQAGLKKMGYSTSYTRLLDNGGTLFSDALLGVTDVITANEKDARIYSLQKSMGNMLHYKTQYNIVTGLLLSEKALSEEKELEEKMDDAENSPFSFQNELFKIISESSQTIIDQIIVEANIKNSWKDEKWGYYTYELEIPVKQQSVFYIYSPSAKSEMYSFFLDGEQLKIPFLSYEDNHSYPIAFRNGIIDCGVYQDEVIHLKIETPYDNLQGLSMGLLKTFVLEQWISSAENQNIECEINLDTITVATKTAAGYLYLPLAYHKGYEITVNKERVDTETFLGGNYLAIPVPEGLNHILIRYRPYGIGAGAWLTALGFLGLIWLCFYDLHSRFLMNLCNIILNGMYCEIILIIYLLPLCSTAFLFIWLATR